MYILEKAIGAEDFEKGMHRYFENWKFRHPYPEDLQSSLEQITHRSLDKLFALLHQRGSF
jgi:aminopeptidase N